MAKHRIAQVFIVWILWAWLGAAGGSTSVSKPVVVNLYRIPPAQVHDGPADRPRKESCPLFGLSFAIIVYDATRIIEFHDFR